MKPSFIFCILSLLLTFATQSSAEDRFFCGPPELVCSVFLPDVPPDCVGKSSDTLVPVEYPHTINNKLCPTQCNVMSKIYDNCLLDKMKGRAKNLAPVAMRSCERIACNPSFLMKLKYK